MIHLSKECFRFYIGDESRVVIEDTHKRDNSIFSEVYSKAFKVLNDLLPLLEMDKKKNVQDEEQESPCPSNIFAFIGDRGAGKTSCMKSVAKMLRSNNSVSESESVLPNFKGKKFEVLESTDPSFFSDNKNILEIFIGRLFSRFRNYVEKSERGKESEKNQVYQLFERVKQSLVCMEKKCIEEDDCAEQLIGLSASVELQNNIQNLINKFLNYIGKDFLVIPIDDLDLHTIHAFNMAEQIRKYLTQKNTIILMALKIEQLEYAVERHYVVHYKLMLEKNFVSNENISDMASKYVVKLIPQGQRFLLKTIEEIVNDCIEIVEKSGSIPLGNNVFIYKKNKPLKYNLVNHIYHETGILFSYNSLNILSITTLRELRHFIDLLYKMHDNSGVNDKKNNIKRLRNYIIDKWTDDNIGKNKTILKEISTYQFAKSINQFVIHKLWDIVYKQEGSNDPSTNNREINQILRKDNVDENVSLGDVLAVFHFIESRTYEEKIKRLLLGGKIIYSMLLQGSHNSLFLDSSKEILNKEYLSIIGRNSINANDIENKLQGTKYRFDYAIIPLNEINKLYDKYKKDKEKNYKYLNLIEFLVLSIERSYYFRNDDSYRSEFIDVNKNILDSGYVYFNIFCILSNLFNVEKTYRRFSDELWKDVQSDKQSLFNHINNTECYKIESIDVLETILASSNEIDLTFNQNDFTDWNQQNNMANEPLPLLEDIITAEESQVEYMKDFNNPYVSDTRIGNYIYNKLEQVYNVLDNKQQLIGNFGIYANLIYNKIFNKNGLRDSIREVFLSIRKSNRNKINNLIEWYDSNRTSKNVLIASDLFSEEIRKYVGEKSYMEIRRLVRTRYRININREIGSEGYEGMVFEIRKMLESLPVID